MAVPQFRAVDQKLDTRPRFLPLRPPKDVPAMQRTLIKRTAGFAAAASLFILSATAALAADGAAPVDSGGVAWVLTASALVLFMTLPGLALFYGGLVRARNVLSVLMH